jgi:FMNH2-dependent dimethyl sulfone monooxygenase
MPLQQGAYTLADVETETSWYWAYQSRLALMADELGLDYLFMGSQYFPPEGLGGHHRTHSLEALMLAAALAAKTRQIYLIPTFSTVAEASPLYFARLASTLDHISNGRIGFNLMANQAYSDFGKHFGEMEDDLPRRYAVAHEFLETVKLLWSRNESVTHHGQFFDIYNATVSPKPIQSPFPLLMTAGLANVSLEFAARHCDLVFSVPGSNVDDTTRIMRDIRESGERLGRRLRPTALVYVICREREAEARARFRYIQDRADPASIGSHVCKFGRSIDDKADVDSLRAFGGNATGQVLVGTPEHVANELCALHKQGVEGVQIAFCDYVSELPFFAMEVIGYLRRAGLRP